MNRRLLSFPTRWAATISIIEIVDGAVPGIPFRRRYTSWNEECHRMAAEQAFRIPHLAEHRVHALRTEWLRHRRAGSVCFIQDSCPVA